MNIIIPKISGKTVEFAGKKELLRGILVILLSGASAGGASPLGLACAAAMSRELAYIPLVALGIGAFIGKSFTLKYICGYVFFGLLCYLRRSSDKSVKAVALGFSLLFTGAAELFLKGGVFLDAVYLTVEAFAVGLAYLLFLRLEEKNGIGGGAILVAVSGVLNCLAGFSIPKIGINAGAMLSIFVSACMCYAYNLPTAVFGSAVMGFLVHINSSGSVEMMGAYVLASLMGALMSGMGKQGVCAGFLCGITVWALTRGSLFGIGFFEILGGVGLFAVLPERVHYRIYEALNNIMEGERESDASNKKIALQLKNVATAMQNLAEGITRLPRVKRDKGSLLVVFDAVASRVCKGCSMEGNCWKKESKKTYGNMYELWNVIEEEGYCDYGNIPMSFRQVCMRCEGFLTEFNHAYELYKQSCLHLGEALAERDMVARQYGELSNVISGISRQVENGREERSTGIIKFRPEITFCQEPKKGQAVSGDTFIHFEKQGKYFVILCDGMGHGETALSQSRLTARLFGEFLKAGFRKEVAVNMINSTLAMNTDKESFSTVDLLEIDMETGKCEFLKIGSAQSFLKTKAGIEEISSKALPVGILESIEVETGERELKNNDVILMVSDGIGEAGEGVMKSEWIKKMLMLENRSDEDILKLITEGARARSRTEDDLTGVMIRIKRTRGDTGEGGK